MERTRILYLCTGNSARSQMAEAWTNQLKGDSFDASSAGVEVHGINPLTIEVMREAGVDMSTHRSKHAKEFLDAKKEFDYVVTLCDEARASCPFYPGKLKIVHRGFKDPAQTTGSREDKLAVFRRVRDEIRRFVEQLPESLEKPEGEDSSGSPEIPAQGDGKGR